MSQYYSVCDLITEFGTVTYISWASDFALYLQDYFLYEHESLEWIWLMLDFRIKVGHGDLYLCLFFFFIH